MKSFQFSARFKRINRAGIAAALMAMASLQSAFAATPGTLSQVPLFLVTSATPLVMLNMSNDHQLFYKAYDDWSDVDGDGDVDTTYDHSIDYYGYFDSNKCYEYNSGVFEPRAISATKYCDTVSGDWSGNFLNWATMTRIDTVRKILYGGLRVVDHGDSDADYDTILERAFLPSDAHSFAKFYGGGSAEISRLTPWSVDEITLCNTTYGTTGVSENNNAPPQIRVAEGNFALWAANERWQCHWDNEAQGWRWYTWSTPDQNMNNGNNPADSGLDAHFNSPSWGGDSDGRLGNDRLGIGNYIARVQVCVPGLIGNENCKIYPSGNPKPIGVLQQYGDEGLIHFGLMTGSYARNKSGGALRKNVGDMFDEINTTTDGTFRAAPAAGSIISNLNALRVSGYSYSDAGVYNNADNCAWGLNNFNNGRCTNWGNPQAEMYLESLRYLAGASPNPNFNANDSAFINNFTTASSWTDPLNNDNYCAPLTVIQFNASVSSYDTDELGGAGDLHDMSSVAEWTDKVGTGEGVAGGDYFIGVGSSPDTFDGLCTAKALGNLSDAEGLCPEAPRLQAGFDIAGLAYYSHTTSIRDDLTDVNGDEAEVLVKTFGVTLSPAVPKIEVPVPGSDDIVTILPACRNQSVNGNCAIVDFKIVSPHTETAPGSGVFTGRFYVNWEDSEQGGDYDQDMAGSLRYEIDASTITVTTQTFGQSTPNRMGFGYVISGTDMDGFHAHSGINGFNQYDDATGALDCQATTCNNGVGPTSQAYTLDPAGSGVLLRDTLWYAAKWGGFEEEDDDADRPSGTDDPNDIPDQDYEWDANGDGLPDAYFYSTNPAQLAARMEALFARLAADLASASSTAANSQRVDTDTFVFQARFDSRDWSGQVLKFSVNLVDGSLTLDDSDWDEGDAGVELTETGREIITYNPAATGANDDGLPFVWSDLHASQQASLNYDWEAVAVDGLGSQRLDFLRGDRSGEVSNGGSFRDRSRVLGDIVNSGPFFVGDPPFKYPGYLEPSGYETYDAFESRVAGRTSMLWVGANDGMLHGFSVETGVELLAYVPQAMYEGNRLARLTAQDYNHHYFVDGSPTMGDVTFASDQQWHTVLVGGLNAGGKGIYALDVTDPSNFDESNASDIVLWELSATGDFAELGYTFARPAVVKNTDGRWVAVFGNGYAGTSGHAVFYMVDIEDGSLVSRVTLESSSGDNGLSTVFPVDNNGDKTIDAMYAGDLQGNMWKLVPSTVSPGEWTAAWGSTPLFRTPADGSGYRQPITTQPDVGRHPGGFAGNMVYFGTGSYFEVGDNVGKPDVQRFYAIWDLYDQGSTSSLSGAPVSPNITISNNNLLRQCVTIGDVDNTCASNQLTTSGEDFQLYEARFISKNTIYAWHWNPLFDGTDVDNDPDDGKMGWYIDLPEYGEMQVSRPTLSAGRIRFITVTPSTHACSDGGTSWQMALDALDGSASEDVVFDFNGDLMFTEADIKTVNDADGNPVKLIAGGKRNADSGVLQPPTSLTGQSGDIEFNYSSDSRGGGVEETATSAGVWSRGRKSWIQLK